MQTVTQRVAVIGLILLATVTCKKDPKPRQESFGQTQSAQAPGKAISNERNLNYFDPEKAKELAMRFGKTLKGKLVKAMGDDGPEAAVEVCHTIAPKIAAELSNDFYRVRRIGTRIRNLNNTPTAEELTTLSGLSRENPWHVSNDRMIKALFVEGSCLVCHGKTKNMKPGVKDVLSHHYPDDKATDYKLGELRGAIVVERVESNRVHGQKAR